MVYNDIMLLLFLIFACFDFQVMVHIPVKTSVITWDFDILKGDVTFTVLRCRRALTPIPHEHHQSGAGSAVVSTQYIDKHMTVGVDISIVEPPLVCRDGDSIQVRYCEAGTIVHPI